jgi:hypothetical protein
MVNEQFFGSGRGLCQYFSVALDERASENSKRISQMIETKCYR